MGFLNRLVSPLRQIDADPDELVAEAYRLLREIDKNRGLWPAVTALSAEATARIELANYLREHRP